MGFTVFLVLISVRFVGFGVKKFTGANAGLKLRLNIGLCFYRKGMVMNLKFKLIHLFVFVLLLKAGNGLIFAMASAGTSSTASPVVLTVEYKDN